MSQIIDGEKHLDESVERQVLEDAERLLQILTEEIPDRANSVRTLVECLPRLRELEVRIAELSAELDDQKARIAQMVQDKLETERASQELQESLRQELHAVTEERDRYASENLELREELRRRDEVSGVKKHFSGF